MDVVYYIILCYTYIYYIGRDGGAIAAVTGNGVGTFLRDNEIVFENCHFDNNMAQENAGDVFCSTDNILLFSNSVFCNSRAIGSSGGKSNVYET